MLVRALNNSGIERFRAYLAELRNGAMSSPPIDLLEDPGCSVELATGIAVERQVFASRWGLGLYLHEIFSSFPTGETDRNRGLWAWMSLFMFDQVCPLGRGSIRQPGQDYRHIPEFDYRHRHRHLLYGPYSVYRRHGAHSILLLSGPLHLESTVYHEIVSRQDLIANKGVVEACMVLYMDRMRGLPKPGAQDSKAKPGTVRRFVRVLQQLDLTYDIYGMSGKDILGLLPKEFDVWR